MAVRKKSLWQICGLSALTIAVPMSGLTVEPQPEPPRASPGTAPAAPATSTPAETKSGLPALNSPATPPVPASAQTAAAPTGAAVQTFPSTTPPNFGPTGQPTPSSQFAFKFPANIPMKDLLPRAPKVAKISGPVLNDDLTQIPEISFEPQAEKSQGTAQGQLITQAAYQLAKINHANGKKTDAFMTALIDSRPDLAGMPFRMGDQCRTTGAQVQHFNQAAEAVRRALGGQSGVSPGVQQAVVFTQQAAVTQAVLPPSVPVASPVPPSVEPAAQVTAPDPAPAAPVRQAAPRQAVADLEVPAAAPALAPAQAPPVSQIQEAPQLQIAMVSISATAFWQTYTANCDQEDTIRNRQPHDKETIEMVRLARMAALTQILAAESAEIRLGLVRYLGGVPHVEATKALARMILFSPEEDVRAAAIAALKVRREKDYTDTLLKGLRYPWPAVAKRAADAIAKLERTDLVPELLTMLESSDPRLPEEKESDGKVIVREMVKLNHHRNCMLCHPPSGSGAPNPNALQAEVAVQDQPLPAPSDGYRQSRQDLLIRIDATYLRPDFSASLQVKDAHPWPEMQRFDFLVRERKLTKEEAAAYREQLKQKEEGVLSPYHKGAVAALRDLTGKDAAPTAEAWRKLLDKTVKN